MFIIIQCFFAKLQSSTNFMNAYDFSTLNFIDKYIVCKVLSLKRKIAFDFHADEFSLRFLTYFGAEDHEYLAHFVLKLCKELLLKQN